VGGKNYLGFRGTMGVEFRPCGRGPGTCHPWGSDPSVKDNRFPVQKIRQLFDGGRRRDRSEIGLGFTKWHFLSARGNSGCEQLWTKGKDCMWVFWLGRMECLRQWGRKWAVQVRGGRDGWNKTKTSMWGLCEGLATEQSRTPIAL